MILERKSCPWGSHRPEVWGPAKKSLLHRGGKCCTNRKLVKLSFMWNQAMKHTWTIQVTIKSYVLARALRTRTSQKSPERTRKSFPAWERTDRRRRRSNFDRERTTLCDLIPTIVGHLKSWKRRHGFAPQLSFIWHLTHCSPPSCYLLIVYQWQALYRLGLHTSKVKMHSGHRQRITETLNRQIWVDHKQMA